MWRWCGRGLILRTLIGARVGHFPTITCTTNTGSGMNTHVHPLRTLCAFCRRPTTQTNERSFSGYGGTGSHTPNENRLAVSAASTTMVMALLLVLRARHFTGFTSLWSICGAICVRRSLNPSPQDFHRFLEQAE